MTNSETRTAVILMVEDDPEDQALTRKALKTSKLRNQLFVADDGEQALDYLYRRGQFSDPAISSDGSHSRMQQS